MLETWQPILRKISFLALVFGVLFVLAACNGDDDGNGGDDNNNEGPPQSPEAETTPESSLLEESAFDESGFPMSREVVANGGLEVISSNAYVVENQVFLMFVVRNSSDQTIGSVRALVSLLDADNLRLTDHEIQSPYWNIIAGETVTMSQYVQLPMNYDGFAARILPVDEFYQNFTPYNDAEITVEFDSATGALQGTALNAGSAPLVQPIAQFILYDTQGKVLDIVFAPFFESDPNDPTIRRSLAGLDENGMWQPGVTLNLTGQATNIPSNDFSQVANVELAVVGYAPGPVSQ